MEQMNADNAITLVVTSCGRFDLLERTLRSFFLHADVLPAHVVLTEDSGAWIPQAIIDLVHRPCRVTTIDGVGHVGQIASIDRAYALVKTPYVFHLEDDWEFYRTGFLRESLDALERDPKCINHWLRERDDTNGHPIVGDRLRLGHNGRWNGFTFNPTLKRMSDYRKLGSYGSVAHWDPKDPGSAEAAIGTRYRMLGYHATIAEKGYVKHIGEGRQVR